MSMVEMPFESNASKYLRRLESSLRAGALSPERAERLFGDFLAVSEAPPPDSRLRRYFHNADVLRLLAETLFVPFSTEMRELLVRTTTLDAGVHRLFFFRADLPPSGDVSNALARHLR